MKWLEFIKVQTANSNVVEILLKLVDECKKCHGLLEARVFHHSKLNDCSVCLWWKTNKSSPTGSDIGQQMSNTLKQYGLVDHSIWVEVNEGEEH